MCFIYSRIKHLFLPQVQPSNYCTFYDDQRQNWSVMFESDKAALDFCKEVRKTSLQHFSVCNYYKGYQKSLRFLIVFKALAETFIQFLSKSFESIGYVVLAVIIHARKESC